MSEHLRLSGSSTPRRTLAGLLLEVESYPTTWTDRVVLVPSDEDRLTAWMRQSLRLTWFQYSQPKRHEAKLIVKLHPPLNVDGAAPGVERDLVRTARAAFYASAGPRPPIP